MKNLGLLKARLVDHLKSNALRTDGPFQLASGAMSDWYLDGRQSTFSGEGSRLVGQCVNQVLDARATAIGGLTLGADPVAVAAAVVSERPLNAFSVRKVAKYHGAGGRLVGPVGPGDIAVVVDDTTTTGASLVDAIEVLREAQVAVVQALVVVDRSSGLAGERVAGLDVPFVALVEPSDLGVGS